MRKQRCTYADMKIDYHSQTLDSFYDLETPFLEDLKVGKFVDNEVSE